MVRNKAQSLINIAGLSVGLTCSLIILLWVQFELSTDAWHKNSKQLFEVYERQYYDNKIEGVYGTPGQLAYELKKGIPEIKYSTTAFFNQWHTFQLNDKILTVNGAYAGAEYFRMFSNVILQGNAQTALNSLSSIVISKNMAEKFFGSPQAAMGKSLRLENKINFIVTAVFDDLPKNTSKKFEYLITWDEALREHPWYKQWDSQVAETFLMLQDDADSRIVEAKITNFLGLYNKEQKSASSKIELGLQGYDKVYLNGQFTNGKIDGGRIEYVRLFSLIAIFILLIASINFMNITTARSIKRAREIGVRKVLGAVRSSLIKQFIGESMLITAVAVIISLFSLILFLPFFNQVINKQIDLPFGNLSFWFKLLGITLITGFVSGSYPALFLSSFNPVKVLQGTVKLGSGAKLFRKSLVIFQFVLAIILIIGTIVIARQVNFIQSKNLGYERENLIYLPLIGDLANKFDVLKAEAMNMPGIQLISRTSEAPTDIENGESDVQWTGKDLNLKTQFTVMSSGYDFINTMKLKLLAGRDHSKDFSTDSSGFLINEVASKRMGYMNPIGKPLVLWGKKGEIIGLIKDFHFGSIHDPIKPLIIRYGERVSNGTAIIRTLPGQTKQALTSLETICKQLNPNFPFNYTFSDEEYNSLYQNEQVIGKLSSVFSLLAIFISCLGLLGQVMFTAEQRIKEIGIRKLLGASVTSIFLLLSSEFLILIVISLLIASPIAYFAMNKWLQNYAYHTDLQWWIFAVSALTALIITFLTISVQSLKAAIMNPIKSLRS